MLPCSLPHTRTSLPDTALPSASWKATWPVDPTAAVPTAATTLSFTSAGCYEGRWARWARWARRGHSRLAPPRCKQRGAGSRPARPRHAAAACQAAGATLTAAQQAQGHVQALLCSQGPGDVEPVAAELRVEDGDCVLPAAGDLCHPRDVRLQALHGAVAQGDSRAAGAAPGAKHQAKHAVEGGLGPGDVGKSDVEGRGVGQGRQRDVPLHARLDLERVAAAGNGADQACTAGAERRWEGCKGRRRQGAQAARRRRQQQQLGSPAAPRRVPTHPLTLQTGRTLGAGCWSSQQETRGEEENEETHSVALP